MSAAPTPAHLVVGGFFLVGSTLLLPGFHWIAPIKVEIIPIPHGPKIYVPIFKDEYSIGIDLIIVGVALVILGAVGQLGLTCRAPSQASAAKFGAIMLLIGSFLLEIGCIIYLPQFARPNDKQHRPPAEIFGQSAPDVGTKFFQAASCLYLISAITAIGGSALKIHARKKNGDGVVGPSIELLAFCLFIPTSVLFFANGMLPQADALKAGAWRMAAAVCLFSACGLLFLVALIEFIVGGRSGSSASEQSLVTV